MVKGTSRQVILVQGAGEKLFEQAIFILRDSALGEGITDEELLKEARSALRGGQDRERPVLHGAFWAAAGALATGLAWLLTAVF